MSRVLVFLLILAVAQFIAAAEPASNVDSVADAGRAKRQVDGDYPDVEATTPSGKKKCGRKNGAGGTADADYGDVLGAQTAQRKAGSATGGNGRRGPPQGQMGMGNSGGRMQAGGLRQNLQQQVGRNNSFGRQQQGGLNGMRRRAGFSADLKAPPKGAKRFNGTAAPSYS